MSGTVVFPFFIRFLFLFITYWLFKDLSDVFESKWVMRKINNSNKRSRAKSISNSQISEKLIKDYFECTQNAYQYLGLTDCVIYRLNFAIH